LPESREAKSAGSQHPAVSNPHGQRRAEEQDVVQPHRQEAQRARPIAINDCQPLALKPQVLPFVRENLLADSAQQFRPSRSANRSVIEQGMNFDGNNDGGRDFDARFKVPEKAEHGVAPNKGLSRNGGQIEESPQVRSMPLFLANKELHGVDEVVVSGLSHVSLGRSKEVPAVGRFTELPRRQRTGDELALLLA